MTDENPTTPADIEAGTPVGKILAPESFDVNDWLNDTEYATKTVEVFNKGELLQELAELSEFVAKQHDLIERRKVNKQALIGSIADENDGVDYEALIAEAERSVDAIVESMRGTGIVVHLRGIAPGRRKVIEDKISRSIKPKPAKYEEIEGERVVVEEAVPGGRQSPEWATIYAIELTAVSIVKIVSANGAVQEAPVSVDTVRAMSERLITPEFTRLANAAYESNFYSYDIDSKVTVDF